MTTPVAIMMVVGVLNIVASLAMRPSGTRALCFLIGTGLVAYGLVLTI
jgi:hypothetical protein